MKIDRPKARVCPSQETDFDAAQKPFLAFFENPTSTGSQSPNPDLGPTPSTSALSPYYGIL
jgi:hypothetical protein